MEEPILDPVDIPKGHVLTFALYLFGSGFYEGDVMHSWKDLQQMLEEEGSDFAKNMAKQLDTFGMDDFDSLEEFMK